MKLKRRIIEQRVDKLDKLSKAERRRALADPEHLVSIGENSAFKEIEERCPQTPSWESIRERVLERATQLKARTGIRRLFAGMAPRWYAGATLAVVLVAIIWVIAALSSGNPSADDEHFETRGKRVVVHYADSRNLFGHTFNP